MLSLYVLLEGLHAAADQEHGARGIAAGYVSPIKIGRALLGWYRAYQSRVKPSPSPITDTFELMLRWHSAFLALVIDLDVLEDTLSQPVAALSETVARKAQTATFRRGVLHAISVLNCFDTIPRGRDLPLHVMPSIYSAILVIHVWTQADLTNNRARRTDNFEFPLGITRETDWQEIGLAAVTESEPCLAPTVGTPNTHVISGFIATGGCPTINGMPIHDQVSSIWHKFETGVTPVCMTPRMKKALQAVSSGGLS
jgi:hypothetical protein